MNWDSIWGFIGTVMSYNVEVWLLLLVVLVHSLLTSDTDTDKIKSNTYRSSSNAMEIEKLKKMAHEE